MLYTHFKIGLRGLAKNKFQTTILVGGLTVGMAACLLLLQYVGYELSFDQFHTKRERIYRVVNERFQNGKPIQKGTITYPTIGAAMQRDFQEVANHTRIEPLGETFVRYEDNLTRQDNMIMVDEHFFEMFDFSMLARSAGHLLSGAHEVVLTRSVADQHFPTAKGDYTSVLGKAVFINRETEPYKIVGVCADVPPNSLLQFNLLASYATYIRQNGKDADESWTWSGFWHFIELVPGADEVSLEAKLPAFSERYFQGEKVSGSREVFSLQPLKDAHLFSQGLEYEIGETTNGRAVWSLLIIAFFILVIAWINYVNLSSVRTMERAKEVGIRKAIGAQREQLMGQFMSEALVVNIVALGLAILLAKAIKPWFSANFDLNPEALSLFLDSKNVELLIVFGGIMLLGIALSGAYPAWLTSASPLAGILKGMFRKGASGESVRKGLVVFQFAASVALILSAVIVSRQIRFISQQDVGLDIDQILTVDGPRQTGFDSTFISKMDAFRRHLQRNPHIKSTATSNRTLDENRHGRIFRIKKTSDNSAVEQFTSSFIFAGPSFAETYKLESLAGRFFRETDYNPAFEKLDKIVVNEAAVKMLGYNANEAAIGQTIDFWENNWTIVGVLPNFHDRSLHHAIEPLFFMPAYGTEDKLSLLMDGQDMEATLSFIREAFGTFFPGNVFEYTFLNQSYQKLYEVDRRFGRILDFFTGMTILIACLGLFGLASYTTILRTKEIGIRKVLGASIPGIVGMLSKDFLILVFIAILIASPIAYYVMQKWLSDFAYRIDMQWWMFAAAGAIALAIAFLTVGGQAVKAALANPVKSLRAE
jgi:putative ABC transport system permease protein